MTATDSAPPNSTKAAPSIVAVPESQNFLNRQALSIIYNSTERTAERKGHLLPIKDVMTFDACEWMSCSPLQPERSMQC